MATFDEVKTQPGYLNAPPEVQAKIADDYFSQKVAGQPGFANADADTQSQIRTDFNKRYDVGHVGLTDDYAEGDPAGKLLGGVQKFGDLATFGVPARAFDAANFGVGDTAKTRDAGLAEYQNDPGLYGDLYRTSQNPLVKTLGGIAGAAHGTGVLQEAAGGLGGMLSGASKALGAGLERIASPFIGTTERAAGTLGVGAYSGINNAVQALQGNENPLQAIGNTAFDTGTAGLSHVIPNMGGWTGRGINGLVQGLGGAIQGGGESLLGDLTNTRPLDFKRAGDEAIKQGGLGLGMGLADSHAGSSAKVKEVQKAPISTLNGKVIRERLPFRGDPNLAIEQGQNLKAAIGRANTVREIENKNVETTAKTKSVDEKSTLQLRRQKLKANYERLSKLAQVAPSGTEKRNAEMLAAKVLKQYEHFQNEYDQKYGETARQAGKQKQDLSNPEDFKAAVAVVKHMRSEGNTKQADRLLSQFEPGVKARVYDEVKKYEALSKQKIKQASESNKALNKAEEKHRALKNKQLAGSIKERTIEEQEALKEADLKTKERQADVQFRQKHRESVAKATETKTAKPKAQKIPRMAPEAIRAEVTKAQQAGESIKIRYYAEKHGETGEYHVKTVHNPALEIGRNGQMMVRGINADGQARTYLEKDKSGSQIVGAIRTGQPDQFKTVTNEATGKREVINQKTGETVPVLKKEAVKSSELRNQIASMPELVAKIKKGQRVSVSDIHDIARTLSSDDIGGSFEKMPQKARAELYNKETGEPC